MLTMTATLVSAQDMADVRRWADEAVELAGPGDEYIATRAAAAKTALDWADGTRASAPVSGRLLEPTRENMEWESLRALDEESALRRVREHGTWPGTIRETLEYVLGRADAPF